ncbi:hypothetical protein HW555_012641 [Spodoptera exigua]|uniref:PiggyBac transposable element-derived protein domain-containing protein n=1 Tax=Spodoptera exigua TaxID=7107 RepID=A0A835KZE9_SPOEX|nr:hypothetical protein HW555_012641 [Spodoptera exigua]
MEYSNMDARKERKVLTKKLLEEAVQNLDDLSDLSGSDSEDDSCFINSIHSPSDSYLNQIDDNLIEQCLEHIFGFGLTGDEQEPSTPPMQTQQMSTDALLTVLDETSHFTNTPKTDNRLLPTHLESETNNEVRRDRSQPRVWEIKSETHEVPLFEKRFKPKANDTHKTSPLSIFERLFPDELMVIIVEQTNRYARQKSSTNWKPVTLQDIKAYLGVLILMGLNPLPDMELYWSSDPFYYNKKPPFNDNDMKPPRNSPEYDKLFKLRPLLTELNKEVTVLTTAHQPLDTRMIKRTQKDGSRADILYPAAIASYTLSMGGVDLFDHFRSSYPINRKSRKYWMRLFFFLFDASIINAYITYNYSRVPTLHGHRDFRLRRELVFGSGKLNYIKYHHYNNLYQPQYIIKVVAPGLPVPIANICAIFN